MINLHKGDCLQVMDMLIEQCVKVDAIITDPPYGTTACKWDSVIQLDILWPKLYRLLKPNGIIVMTAAQPYTSILVTSNLKGFKYSLVYEKTTPTGHLNAKKMPMRSHEDILVFYNKLPTYNPQKTTGHPRKVSSAKSKEKCTKTEVYGEHGLTSYDSTERYPKSVLKFSTDKQKSAVHPTQKPVALMEYLIKTYTNEGELVLDFTMGSGTTGVACKNTDRKFIGIELDKDYFKIAEDRINDKGNLFNAT